MWGILVGIVSGTLMGVQGVFNTALTKQTNIWIAAGFVQATALIVCILAWFATGGGSSVSDIARVQPRYILVGGIMGAFITYTVVIAVSSVGPARAALFIVIAQLLVSYIIELFGWFGVEKQPLELRKVIGLVVAVVGIITFKWK